MNVSEIDYSHEDFLKSRMKKMKESEVLLRKTFKQMINGLKFGRKKRKKTGLDL